MIKTILGFIILVFAAVVIGLSIYLQPNDLLRCGTSPGVGQNCHPVGAIVAISGGDTVGRASQAISLYQHGWSDKLIFAGAAQDKSGPSNALVMKKIAISAGVPESNIYIDEYSENTKQNAQNVQTIFAEHKITKIILVTSGYHQRRASLEFNKQASYVEILNKPSAVDKDWTVWWWLNPYGWWLAISEIVKIIVFLTVGS
ncbi:YdcF family protein [Candidatus Saccharibacteria bacterium]|nr:YdcF family protein [Candidatus Saccharibacteria bacterium]